MKIDTLQPASFNGAIKCASLFSSLETSKPPSVVRSSRFSGTKQTACGLNFKAISCISVVAAISKFSGTFRLSISLTISESVIWRRSSLKCAVIPSAPAASAIFAALNGSGTFPPLAFLTVAT